MVTLMLMSVVGTGMAKEPARKTKRVESIHSKNKELFAEIQAAFEIEDLERVHQLLDKLESDSSNGNLSVQTKLHSLISRGELSRAGSLVDKVTEDAEMSDIEKAYVYKAMGDAYFERDNLDAAIIEYKKIIELREHSAPKSEIP